MFLNVENVSRVNNFTKMSAVLQDGKIIVTNLIAGSKRINIHTICISCNQNNRTLLIMRQYTRITYYGRLIQWITEKMLKSLILHCHIVSFPIKNKKNWRKMFFRKREHEITFTAPTHLQHNSSRNYCKTKCIRWKLFHFLHLKAMLWHWICTNVALWHAKK